MGKKDFIFCDDKDINEIVRKYEKDFYEFEENLKKEINNSIK